MTRNPTFLIRTLGCKVNQYEEQVIREAMTGSGFVEVVSGADAVIVNSCTVTHRADQKTRGMVRRLRRDNPAACIAVTGCYAVTRDDIETLGHIEEIDVIIPNKDKARIPVVMGNHLGISAASADFDTGVSGFKSHARAFLKVQDGCDRRCSYCKVNIVRGPSRSRPARFVVDEFRRLIQAGYREIVLTGICLGDWKGDRGERFPWLLRETAGIYGDHRIRISSIEPDFVDQELIDVMAAHDRVCEHLHLPLQSGSDRMLSIMGRKYSAGDFRGIVAKIRSRMPLAGITMDVIAGFPGESDKDFTDTVAFLKDVQPSRLHVFGYSERKGAPSSRFPEKISEKIKKERVERLVSLGERSQKEFCESFAGKNVEVMVEAGAGAPLAQGYTAQYVRATVPGALLREGQIVNVMAEKVDDKGLMLVTRIPATAGRTG